MKAAQLDEAVELYETPWVSATRVASYRGNVSARKVYVRVPTPAMFVAMLRRLRRRALEVEANSVVAVEIHIDPFHEDGCEIKVSGQAAVLEPLF